MSNSCGSYIDLADYTCPVCGKSFVVMDPDQWVYKNKSYSDRSHKSRFVCSYSCYLKINEKFFCDNKNNPRVMSEGRGFR